MQSFFTRLFSGNFAVLQVVCKKVIAFVLDQERPPTKNTQFDRTKEKTYKCSIIKSEVKKSMINEMKNGNFFGWHTLGQIHSRNHLQHRHNRHRLTFENLGKGIKVRSRDLISSTIEFGRWRYLGVHTHGQHRDRDVTFITHYMAKFKPPSSRHDAWVMLHATIATANAMESWTILMANYFFGIRAMLFISGSKLTISVPRNTIFHSNLRHYCISPRNDWWQSTTFWNFRPLCPRRNCTDVWNASRYMLSEPVSRNQLTWCARLSMGNVLFYALYLRFVWVLISFWAKPFDNWGKIMHIGTVLSCCSLLCDVWPYAGSLPFWSRSNQWSAFESLNSVDLSLTEYKLSVTCTCCRLSCWSPFLLCANVIHQNNFSEIY